MAVEPGGIASKLGAIYEVRYACHQVLRLLGGQLIRLRWEPSSGETGGADVELERSDGVIEHVQLKRQNGADIPWTVATLDAEGVLAAAARLLSADATARFVFVSSVSVKHLQGICDQLSRSDDSADEFVAKRVKAEKERAAAFDELLRRWKLAPEDVKAQATAVERLRRMRWVVLDPTDEGREQLQLSVQQTLTGEPDAAIAHLVQFLEERLSKNVSAQGLQEYLKNHGIEPKDLARDPSLPSSVFQLRDEFRDSLRERLVAGKWLQRSQVGEIIDRIVSDTPPRVVLVHGKPGAGKSGVLLGIADGLVKRDVLMLPLSLSSRPPEGSVTKYGESLGLRASPVAALRAFAGTSRAVLLVDQLDALRMTTSGAAATWQVCERMLSSAASDPNTVLVVACRTFDLDNDVNIRQWKRNADRRLAAGVVSIEVGDLAPADIEPVLSTVGVAYSVLPARLQKLLVHPNTLDAWHRLAKAGSTRRDFATQTQLLAELMRVLRLEAAREHHVPEAAVSAVLRCAREHMESTGGLTVPASTFEDQPAALDACCSVGLLVRHGTGRLSFPHQSYYDHLVARAALRVSGRSPAVIAAWIKRDQSLHRRDQVRQLLFTLRDEEPPLAARVAEAILLDAGVRFHLKLLVCGVLHEAELESITPEDVCLVATLAGRDEWREHVRTKILGRSIAWFDALFAAGMLKGWLAEPRDDLRSPWVQVVLGVVAERPLQVDALLAPLLATPTGEDTVARLLWHDPLVDSPRTERLRNRLLRQGRGRFVEAFVGHVAERNPARAVRLLADILRGALRRSRTSVGAGGEISVEDLLSDPEKKNVLSAVRANAWWCLKTYSRLLRLAERLQSGAGPANESAAEARRRVLRSSAANRGISDGLTALVADAVAALSESHQEQFPQILASMKIHKSELLAAALYVGLARSSPRVSDAALGWLCSERTRFAVRGSVRRDEHGLAADVVRRHALACSEATLERLASLVLSYYPQHEKDEYRHRLDRQRDRATNGQASPFRQDYINPIGRAQQLLLSAIPEARRSAEAQRWVRLWEAKFLGPPVERLAGHVRGGWVGSTIPQDRLARVSDRQWLRMVSTDWHGGVSRQMGPNQVGEASHEQFSTDLGRLAKAQPRRFVHLALSFPLTTDPLYFAHLWDALAEQATDVAACNPLEVEALLDRTSATMDGNALSSACRAIDNHTKEEWREAAWNLLDAAVTIKDLREEEELSSLGQAESRRSDIEDRASGSVRGAAASALASLAWDDSQRAGRVIPLARRLAADPEPGIRLAAAHTALGIYTTNRDEGAALLGAIVAHQDDRILSGRAVQDLLRYVRWSHPGLCTPVFERMVRSTVAKVAEAGAGWVTAEYFQRGASAETFLECRNGSVQQRVGMAEVLGQLLVDEKVEVAKIETEVANLFDDPAAEVRKAAAGVFRLEGVLQCEAGSRLASSFVRSAAFVEHSEGLLWPVVHETVDLIRFAPAIFAAAERFAKELADQTRTMATRLGLAGEEMSSLLLRLYDAACKTPDKRVLAEACLDHWDLLLANRVGDAEKHLEALIG